jgi:hypothetical protein
MPRQSSDLPQYSGQTPSIVMPDGAEQVASRVAAFGNIVQNFTMKGTEFAGQQVGLKEKATEMVLKTNVDNAMRAFARSSTNQFDPKTGITNFEEQADNYTNKLIEGVGGMHAETIKAYAEHAKATNLQPLHAAAVKQAFNETRMNFLDSINNYGKDISQSINLIPFDEAVSHHEADDAKPAGQIAEGNIDLTNRPHVKNKDGSISTVRSITIEEDGRYIVIPTVTPWGEVISDKEAIDLYHEEYEHLGVFKTQKQADKFAQKLHESEARKLNGEAEPAKKRIAPSIDAVQYNLSQVLNQIETAGRTGVISPSQAVKLKEKIISQTNDEMLYHKYQLAVENGQGDAFIQSYAKSQKGHAGAATFAKHIAEFKKIEHRDLAEQAISESTAREFMTDNVKNLELGKPNNVYADSLASNAPNLFPNYGHDKKVAELSGGLYKQFTAGTEAQALALFTHLQQQNTHPDMPAADKAVNQQALDSALKNTMTYFKDLKDDPQKFLLEKNLLGDIATQQKIQEKSGVYLPDDLKLPEASTLRASIEWQRIHGIPANQAQLITNAQAREFGGRLLSADPSDKVRMIQSITKQYGKYAPNVMQQLIAKGGVPREYGWFTSLDPESGALPDVVNAITNTALEYSTEQKNSVKTRVDKAMNVASERAHPDVGTTRRFLGFAYQQVRGAVTGREFDATQTNTGLFGTPALFNMQSTPSEVKLKALTESMMSASGYNTGELLNTIDTTVNKLTNFYIKMRGLTEEDALSQSVRAIADQYEMVDYKDNIIRLPKHKINYNDFSSLAANTTELINKVDWQLPMKGDYGTEASRTDNINYFKQNIENGHWATDPTDQGLVWVNANGMVNKMKNGNPLFISFESMQRMNPIDFKKLNHIDLGTQEAQSHLNKAFELLKKNNVSFNQEKMGIPNDENIELNKIPNAFGTFEKMSSMAVSRSKEFYNYLFEDMQERQRKFANRTINTQSVTKDLTRGKK